VWSNAKRDVPRARHTVPVLVVALSGCGALRPLPVPTPSARVVFILGRTTFCAMDYAYFLVGREDGVVEYYGSDMVAHQGKGWFRLAPEHLRRAMAMPGAPTKRHRSYPGHMWEAEGPPGPTIMGCGDGEIALGMRGAEGWTVECGSSVELTEHERLDAMGIASWTEHVTPAKPHECM
jgi:hypothetical protein